jgi:hypothetical protein
MRTVSVSVLGRAIGPVGLFATLFLVEFELGTCEVDDFGDLKTSSGLGEGSGSHVGDEAGDQPLFLGGKEAAGAIGDVGQPG